MKDYQTGAVRDTGGKGRMDLLPWSALLRVSRHMEDAIKPDPETGKPHYPERNWEKGLPLHTMIDSAFRHLAKYVEGMDDEDHLCAAATNLLMALWTEEHRPEMQDIPSRSHGRPFLGPSGTEEPLAPVPSPKAKEEATETREEVCHCYDPIDGGRCHGTKEIDHCYCKGNRAVCDFYPEKCAVAVVPRQTGGPVAE